MNKLYLLLCLSICIISCDTKPADDQTTEPVSNSTIASSENGTRGRTEAGYEYIHHISNNTEKPVVGDQVKYHKLVYKNDTTLLQSTYYLLEPRADVLIPRDSVPQPPHPTYDALFLMSPGDSLTVFQELDTFPAEKLPEGITNEDRFTYNLRMISIKPKAQLEKELNAIKARHQTVGDSLTAFIKAHKAGKLDDQIMTSDSTGLQYIIHKKGDGEAVKDGGFVKVHYMGMLEDGTVFDATFLSTKPFPTRIGRKRVIAGWDEGIPLLKEGGEATFFVPYQSAYGIAGKPPGVPQRANLYFFVSLVGVY